MKVRSILENKGSRVVTIRPDATIAITVARMRLERIGCMVVSEDAMTVQGLISEREIAHGLAEHGVNLPAMHVADLMIHRVPVCGPDDSIKKLMATMTLQRVRHMPVVEHHRLIGIVSIGDIVKNRMEEIELETNVLRDAYVAAH